MSAILTLREPQRRQERALADPWFNPDLALLGSGRRPAPDFPLDQLSPFWSEWVRRRAEAACAPVDYVALSLLSCAGSTLANVRWAQIGAAWKEPPHLWAGIVGSPSSGKSPAMDAAFDLVARAEELMCSSFDAVLQQYETRKQAARATREAWELEVKAAIKAGERVPPFDAAANEPVEPIRPRIRVADFTTEKLGHLAAGLPRGLLVVRDELAGWFGAFDKYGGGGSDRAFAIEMYGGRAYVIDRVKSREPLRIRHLSVGVLGGVQPDKLAGIVEGPDDGLVSRFLWSWPENAPPFRLTREYIDDEPARRAFARLAALPMATDESGNPAPLIVRADGKAEGIIENFGRAMAERAEVSAGALAGAYGKARGHAVRLATIIEFLSWAASGRTEEPYNISANSMLAAAALLDAYFLPMAERVFCDAAIPMQERRAMALARHLRRDRLEQFNARDARRQYGGIIREAAAMDSACVILVEAGLIRPQFARSGDSKGRTSKFYDVHPIMRKGR